MKPVCYHAQHSSQTLHPRELEDQAGVRVFTGNAVASRVLTHMLTSDESLSDVCVRAGGKEFQCHRAVLAASSPVFRAMFRSDMREPNTGILSLPDDVTPSVFAAVRDYLYGRPLCVAANDAIALSTFIRRYEVASAELQPFLDNLLASAITLDNFTHIRSHADNHAAHNLRRACDRFVTARMDMLMRHPTFLELDSDNAEATLRAPCNVSRDSVSSRSAQHVFYAAIAWLQYQEEPRAQYLDRMLATVQLESMSLPGLVRASREPLAAKSQSFQRKLLRAFADSAERYVCLEPISAPNESDILSSNSEPVPSSQSDIDFQSTLYNHRHQVDFLTRIPSNFYPFHRRNSVAVPFVHPRFPRQSASPPGPNDDLHPQDPDFSR